MFPKISDSLKVMKTDDILKHDFLKPIEAPYSPFSSSFQATTGATAAW